MKSIRLVAAALVGVLCLSGCDIFGPPPDGPTGVTVTVGHESLTISWTAMSDASSYSVYFTVDGTAPTSSSSLVGTTQATTLTHEDLDDAKTYAYAIIGSVDGRSTKASTTTGVSPEPILRVIVTFDNYADSAAGAFLIEYDSAGDALELAGTAVATTTAAGEATFALDIFRGRYWGFTVYKDIDSSGTMTPGDEVWGSEPDKYSTLWWKTPLTASFAFPVDWEAWTDDNPQTCVYAG